MAFPGQSGSLWEIMARDAFADALNEPMMRVRVLERDPSTLEEALKIAARLEALRPREPVDEWDECGRRKDRFVKATTLQNETEIY